MIRVTVELIPGGYGKPRLLGSLEIINTGKGTRRLGDYITRLKTRTGSTSRLGQVKEHARLDVSVWKLAAKALSGLGHTA